MAGHEHNVIIDIIAEGFQWRGYPVAIITKAAAQAITGSRHGLLHVLRNAVDMAGPDEPSNWMFESEVDGCGPVWIERFGDPPAWSVYLPDER